MQLKSGSMKVVKTIDISKGVYLLELQLRNPTNIYLNRFGDLKFPAGFYYYSGSAMKNLKHRVNRHLATDKKIKWHIDYLTSNKNFEKESVFLLKADKKEMECDFVQQFEAHINAEHKFKKFGSSDCRTCKSHLLYLPSKIDHNQLLSLYQSMVRLIPSSKDIS